MYCLNRAVSGPVLSTGLQVYCINRAVSVSVLGTGLQMYCINRAVPGPVLGIAARCAFAALRRHRAVAVSSSVTDLCSRV